MFVLVQKNIYRMMMPLYQTHFLLMRLLCYSLKGVCVNDEIKYCINMLKRLSVMHGFVSVKITNQLKSTQSTNLWIASRHLQCFDKLSNYSYNTIVQCDELAMSSRGYTECYQGLVLNDTSLKDVGTQYNFYQYVQEFFPVYFCSSFFFF